VAYYRGIVLLGWGRGQEGGDELTRGQIGIVGQGEGRTQVGSPEQERI